MKQCLAHCKHPVSLLEMHTGLAGRTKFSITRYIVIIWNCNIVVGLFLKNYYCSYFGVISRQPYLNSQGSPILIQILSENKFRNNNSGIILIYLQKLFLNVTKWYFPQVNACLIILL